jgi:transcriptional regulator with XRE-family HTH domain
MTELEESKAYARLRDLLVYARRKAHLTQSQISARLNRPQSFVSKYERGERRLDVVEFVQVARALDIDPVQLLARLNRELS